MNKSAADGRVGSGALFGVWAASSASAAAYAVTARGAAQPAEKLSTTMTTNPDGKPYIHNAEQSEAAKADLTKARCALSDAKLTIDWQTRQLADLRRVIALVAKHADFSQCPPEVEEEVDRVLRGEGGPAS